MLKCQVCGLESYLLDEVCYYNINGCQIDDRYDIERYAQDPDALAYTLCGECADKFDFDKGVIADES